MRFIAIILALGIATVSCTQTQPQKGKNQPPIDSMSLEIPFEQDPQNMPLPEELTGSWIAVELNVGELIMTAEDMEEQGIPAPTRTFNSNYTMKFGENEDMPLIPFSYVDQIIISDEQGNEMIEKLNSDTLIITHTIDGEKSRYVYVKKK